MTLTDSQRAAIRALRDAGGEGAIDRHGAVVASGQRLHFLTDTWLRLVTLGLLESAGPLRVRLTKAGRREAGAAGRKVDVLFTSGGGQILAHPGAE
ncbi:MULTISPECIES: hypothetical protein [unclassified Methylobacterium]|uniref:hypothetical protein n=1 Tax=unclassified Methylobacterium TaxID=2615210 RepID=UPI0013543744|nr:hypothetical protein [Methylobacterium sp. 2A]MWV22422.1 hypothetical protein [Methylobacterium sp. 2A]